MIFDSQFLLRFQFFVHDDGDEDEEVNIKMDDEEQNLVFYEDDMGMKSFVINN